MKLFIWDFHGVLEKGNDNAVVEITNRVLHHFDYSRRMTIQEGEFLSGRRWFEYFAYLLPHLDSQKHLALQTACIEMSLNTPEIVAKHIQLNDHARLVLEKVIEAQYTQILISNTYSQSLDLFVKMIGIENYFPPTHRFGIDAHHQQKVSKKECLHNFLKGKYFPKGIVTIGDSSGDMAIIENIPDSVSYLYAHPGRTHRIADCQYRINDLRDILPVQ